MPLQNRVTPFGEIVAVPHRGTMMGNRGIIHDPHAKQLLSKRWQHQAWVCCVLAYKDHRHPIMGKSHYTELFFLDEATAFAAGHRPCAYCRLADFRAFLQAWAEGLSLFAAQARAPLLDRRLHCERTTRTRIQITHRAEIGELPDGTFVRIDDRAWLVMGSRLLLLDRRSLRPDSKANHKGYRRGADAALRGRRLRARLPSSGAPECRGTRFLERLGTINGRDILCARQVDSHGRVDEVSRAGPSGGQLPSSSHLRPVAMQRA